MNNGSLSLLNDLQLPLSVDERALVGTTATIVSSKAKRMIALVDVMRRATI